MSNPKCSEVVPMRSLRTGDMVGNYRIEGVLADGGMGVVYRASHAILPRRAAVKVLHPDMIGKWSASERMLQEARVLESIASAAVVQIFDAGLLDDGRPWVAMELVDGDTLAEHLAKKGTLSPDEVAELMADIAVALAPAHKKNVVHRDIKPDNVMLTEREGKRVIKLIDWGIARIANSTSVRLTQVDTTPGTPHYMAPEQIRGKSVDSRTDVYALGVLAFELLTGKVPYRGENSIEVVIKHLTAEPPALSPVCPGIPGALEALITRMLAKDPDKRPTLEEIRSVVASMRDAEIAEMPEMPEIEIEMELDVDDAIAELEMELEEAVLQEAARSATKPALPRRMRWTPPYGEPAAAPAGGIVQAIERALDEDPRGEVRRGRVVANAGAAAAGEIVTRR
jgi:serine/threonine-protein kinase